MSYKEWILLYIPMRLNIILAVLIIFIVQCLGIKLIHILHYYITKIVNDSIDFLHYVMLIIFGHIIFGILLCLLNRVFFRNCQLIRFYGQK